MMMMTKRGWKISKMLQHAASVKVRDIFAIFTIVKCHDDLYLIFLWFFVFKEVMLII